MDAGSKCDRAAFTKRGSRPGPDAFASGPGLHYIDTMSIDTVPTAAQTAPLVRWTAGLGIAALGLAAGVLWWTQGTKVFLDTLAAGLAWCF